MSKSGPKQMPVEAIYGGVPPLQGEIITLVSVQFSTLAAGPSPLLTVSGHVLEADAEV